MIGTELHWIRDVEPCRLALAARPRGNDWLEDELKGWVAAGIRVVVSLLEAHEARELELGAEERICQELGMEFWSFPIRDRGVPESEEGVRRLVGELVGRVQRGDAIVVHCRMGIGRTGVLAGCLVQALGVPGSEIFTVLSRARAVEMPDTEEQRVWVEGFAWRDLPNGAGSHLETGS